MKLRPTTGSASRGSRLRICALALGFCLALPPDAFSIDYPLQPEEVREAYSLGQTTNREELADFLKQYEHDFKRTANDPPVFAQSVEFQTPYEQIVLRTLKTTQYTKFQADDDYNANPGLVVVRVILTLPVNYIGPAPPADSFNLIVSQAKSIEPRSVSTTVLCDPLTLMGVDCTIYMREFLLEFDVSQFAPGKAIIQVGLPSGKTVETKYDLDKLK